MAELHITHLYPETLRLNGEAGNITALTKRANWSGLSVEVTPVELGHKLPKRTDILFIGSGTLSATRLAADALQKHQREITSADYRVLAVGSGWDLISEHFSAEGDAIATLGLTPTNHTSTSVHLVGEVVIGDGANPLAGFINSDRVITGLDVTTALGRIEASDDARLVGTLEGYRSGRILAARLQGPLLPMNPSLADDLLTSVLGSSYQSTAVRADDHAHQARLAIASRLHFKL